MLQYVSIYILLFISAQMHNNKQVLDKQIFEIIINLTTKHFNEKFKTIKTIYYFHLVFFLNFIHHNVYRMFRTIR